MVIIPELKHNAYKKVTIPRASELVAAYGLTRPGKDYSGDDFLNPNASKIDMVKEVNQEAFDNEA